MATNHLSREIDDRLTQKFKFTSDSSKPRRRSPIRPLPPIIPHSTRVITKINPKKRKQRSSRTDGLHEGFKSNFLILGGNHEAYITRQRLGVRQSSAAFSFKRVGLNHGFNPTCQRAWSCPFSRCLLVSASANSAFEKSPLTLRCRPHVRDFSGWH